MSAVVKSIAKLSEVEEVILESPIPHSEKLVIFDMDLTLTIPQIPALTHLTSDKYRVRLKEVLSPLSDVERRKVLALSLQHSEHELVEEGAPAIIKSIQQQGIKVIVLTAILTGRLEDLTHGDRVEVVRFRKLQKLGINLDQAFPIKELILHDLPPYNENYPSYYQGVLCANGERGTNMKGPVLVSFLNHVCFKPKLIIMVDDKRQNLEDVYQSLTAFDPAIKFIGIEYLGARNYISEEVGEEAFIAYWEELLAKLGYKK